MFQLPKLSQLLAPSARTCGAAFASGRALAAGATGSLLNTADRFELQPPPFARLRAPARGLTGGPDVPPVMGMLVRLLVQVSQLLGLIGKVLARLRDPDWTGNGSNKPMVNGGDD